MADVADRFSFSKPDRRGPNDPWFRVGQVEFGTAAVFAALCAVSLLIYGFEPVDKPFLTKLALIPDKVLDGQVWRIATWPLANGFDDRLLWIAVTIALLWYFGGRLEAQAGRTKFGIFLAAVIVLPGIVGTLLDLRAGGLPAGAARRAARLHRRVPQRAVLLRHPGVGARAHLRG